MTGENKGYLKVGMYLPETEDREAVIEREWYGQGHIFKDEDAFLHHPERVCYVPELSDSAYTRQDFLDLCNGQEKFAAECFYAVDWQHPETWVEEQYVNEEWGWCEDCGKIYDMEDAPSPLPGPILHIRSRGCLQRPAGAGHIPCVERLPPRRQGEWGEAAGFGRLAERPNRKPDIRFPCPKPLGKPEKH